MIRMKFYLTDWRNGSLLFHQRLIEMKRTLMRLPHGPHVKEWGFFVWAISPASLIAGFIPGFRPSVLKVVIQFTIIGTKVTSIPKNSGPW